MTETGWVEQALSTVGGWGRLQLWLGILLSVPVLLTGMYGTNYVFLAAQLPYRCHVNECEDALTSQLSSQHLYTKNATTYINHTTLRPDLEWQSWALKEGTQCSRWAPIDGRCTNSSFNKSMDVKCEHFVYETQGSIFSEFNLACQEWKQTLVGTLHNVGMLISLPAVGYISDSWGRRTALIVSGFGVGVVGLIKSFAPSYWFYAALELLETVFGASVYPAAFVLMIEWLGVEQRILASLVLGIPLAAGSAALALLDYLTGYWRLWARIAYPPSVILLLYPWLLPDSVRWLATKGRVFEAVETIKRAAKWNRVSIPEATFDKILVNEASQLLEKSNSTQDQEADENLVKAIFKYSVLRRRLCVCGVWWMSAVFVFYGLAVRSASLAGDRHVNYALLSCCEVLALVINTLLLDRAGRRPLLRLAFIITGLACSIIPFLPDSARAWGTALYLVGKVGATMSLNCLYVYTAELFPTRARHRLLATCSMLGRLGSILAPLTPLLAVYREWLPTLLFGTLPLLSAVLTLLMPETLRVALPDTVADLQRATDTSPNRLRP